MTASRQPGPPAAGHLAGGWAWQQFVPLARLAARRSARTAGGAWFHLLAALTSVTFAWSAVTAGWHLNRDHVVGASGLLVAALVLATFGSAHSARRASHRLRAARARRRDCLWLAASSLPDAAAAPQVRFDALHGDSACLLVRAVDAYLAAGIPERFAPSVTWWHDMRLAANPAIVFDHLGVGACGVVTVHRLVMPTPAALTVDTNASLSCGGVPITAFGVPDLMAWQLRAASSAARAAGLPLTCVTSIVVSNAALVDTWGAPTGVERLQHRDGLVRLPTVSEASCPWHWTSRSNSTPTPTVLAAHQLADALLPANVFHQSPPAALRRRRDGRRYELPHPEVNHARPNTTRR